MTDNTEALYNQFKGSYDLGTIDDFRENLKNSEVRKSMYDELSKVYDLGAYDEYESGLGYAPSPSDSISAQAVDNPNVGQVNTPVAVSAPTNIMPAAAQPFLVDDVRQTAYPRAGQSMESFMQEVRDSDTARAAHNEQIRQQREGIKGRALDKIDRIESEVGERQRIRDNNKGLLATIGANISAPYVGAKTLRDNQRDLELERNNDYQSARIAKDAVAASEEIEKQAEANKTSGFWSNVARGFSSSVGKLSTWDNGKSQLDAANTLFDITKKIKVNEDGSEDLSDLSAAELDALQAEAIKNFSESKYSDDLGHGYAIGSSTAQSLPFMIEMMANPASGLGGKTALKIGKKVAVSVTNNAARKAITAGARVAGDVAGASLMTATTGSVRWAANTVERLNGDAAFHEGPDGIRFNGIVGEEKNFWKALGKSFGSQTIESYSEMFGEYFGIPAKILTRSKFGKNLGIKAASDFVDHITDNGVGRAMKSFTEATKWNGILGEYGEEIAGTIMNAAIVGDEDLSQLLDSKYHIETFGSVSLMSGLFAGASISGYRGEKRRMALRYQSADLRGEELVPSWNSARDLIASMSAVDRCTYLEGVLASDYYNQEQKRIICEFAGACTKIEGYQKGVQSNDNRSTIGSYDGGSAAVEPADRQYAKAQMDMARETLEKAGAGQITEELDKVTDAFGYLSSQRKAGVSETNLQMMEDYLNKKAAYRGMIDTAKEELSAAVNDAVSAVDGRVNAADGMVHSFTDRDGAECYLKTGDGTAGACVVVYEDGSNKMVDASELTATDVRPAEEVKAEIRNAVTESEATRLENEIEGYRDFAPGETVRIDNGSGFSDVAVEGVTETGDYIINDGNGQRQLSREELNRSVNSALKNDPLSSITVDDYIESKGDALTDFGKEYYLDHEDEAVRLARTEAEAALRYRKGEISAEEYLQTIEVGAAKENAEAVAQEKSQYWGDKLGLGEVATEEVPAAQTEVSAEQTTVPAVEEETPATESTVEQTEPVPTDPYADFPRTKKGELDIDKLTPSQLFAYNENEFGRDTAIEDLRDQIKVAEDAVIAANEKVSKVTGTARAKARTELKTKQDELAELRKLLPSDYKNAEEKALAEEEESVMTGTDVKAQLRFIAENSTDPMQIAIAYEESKQFAEEQQLEPWQEVLMLESVSQSSFERFADPNLVTGTLARAWFKKGSRGIDVVAQDILEAETGQHVEPQDVVDFIASHPDKSARKTCDEQIMLGRKFSEEASKIAGTKVGNPDSASGKAFIGAMKAAKKEALLKADVVSADKVETTEILADEIEEFDTRNLASEEELLDLFYGEEISGVTEEEKDEILSTLNQNNDGQSNSIPIGQEDTDGQNQKRDRSGDGSGNERGSESGIEGGRGTEGQEGAEVSRTQQPAEIGNNSWGKVFQWAKGKAVEAANFLKNAKSGYLKGVFYRSGLGEIDLFWGNDKGGLAHIIAKHVIEHSDFASVNEAVSIIDDVISTGEIIQQSNGRIALVKDGKRVVTEKTIDGNWVVTAFDETRKQKEKKRSEEDVTRLHQDIFGKEDGELVSPNSTSVHKDTKESADESGTNENIPNQSPAQSKSILERAKEAAADYNVQREIKAAEAVTDTNPSDAQKEAGNYRKGKVSIDGYTISIENPKGSERSGTDNNGKKWTSKMNNTYGYILGTEGNDKDHLDVFLGDNAATGNVYVVDQSNEDGSFDEHKIMYGFNSVEEAREAYLSNYEAGWESHIMGITPVSKEDFKSWTDNGKKKSVPFAEEHIPGASKKIDGDGMMFREETDELQTIIAKAKADGTYMKAPNGEPTKLNENQWAQVRTKAFKDWFGDWEADLESASKVVDENGEPMVVSHSTNKTFTEFRNKQENDAGWLGEGYYFFGDRSLDGQYGSNVIEAFLDIKEPYYATNEEHERLSGLNDNEASSDFSRSLQDEDYDGVYFNGDLNMEYVAFSPNQIKSATENSGEFSKDNDDIRFREEAPEKSLIGVHNISETKLLKALKQGGLANPSSAVIDLNVSGHSAYGEISLLLPKSLVDGKTGKNGGTYTGDAWTATYPTIERKMSDKGTSRKYKDIQSLPAEVQNSISNQFERFINFDDASGLQYMFLHEQGLNPVIERYESPYSGEEKALAEKINSSSFYKLDKPDIEKAKELYIESEFNGNKEEFEQKGESLKRGWEKSLETHSPESMRYKKSEAKLSDYKEFGFNVGEVKDYFQKITEAVKKDGKFDEYKTITGARDYVSNNSLTGAFEKWVSDLTDRYGIEEKLFDGFKSDGSRKYLPNTAENASRIMNKDKGTNVYGDGGFSATKAGLLQKMTTLAQIRKNRSLLNNSETVDKVAAAKSAELYSIIKELADMQQISDNKFMNIDYAEARLQESFTKKNPAKYLNSEYGYKIDEDGEYAKKITDFVEGVKALPTKYFETKFNRPVSVSEFAAAVVPDNASGAVLKGLKENGLNVVTYKAGDEVDRKRALDEASNNDIRFRFIGEKGAASLDKAEEATTRLDNLSVARAMESEKKDAKAIKMATGWERGADGKWRYETEDAKLKETINIGGKEFKRNENDMLWTSGKLGNVVDSKGLFEAYPQLADVRLETDTIDDDYGSNGSYDSKRKTITIHADKLKHLNNLLNHEIQHAIQDIEGFAGGGNAGMFTEENSDRIKELKDRKVEVEEEIEKGNTEYEEELQEIENELFDLEDDSPFYKYHKLAGEVEARNVERRKELTSEERRSSLASETEDVAREDQIFLNEGLISESRTTGAENAELENVNKKFNEELQQQIEGALPSGHIYKMGSPSNVLLSAGLPNLPIELSASRLTDKSMQDNHPFDLSEVKDLPKAIQNPLAVFRSATHISSYVVMTEIEHNGKNYVVAIEANRRKGKIEINDIRSIHYRSSNAHMANWIDEGLLEYVDKKKMSTWFSKQRYNSAEVRKLYGRAANIVESFDNPTIEATENATAAPTPEQQMSARVTEMSDKLHTDINVVTSVDDLPENVRKRVVSGRKIKGWFDTKTGKVNVYVPAHTSIADVERTVLHEVVAHRGLRELFGEDFDTFLDNAYGNVQGEIKNSIDAMAKKEGLSQRAATEEYLADLAERGFNNKEERGFWQDVKSFIIEMLRKAGVNLGFRLSDNDLRYILWKSHQNLTDPNGDGVTTKARDAVLRSNTIDKESGSEPLYKDDSTSELDRIKQKFADYKADINNITSELVRYVRNEIPVVAAKEMGKADINTLVKSIEEATTRQDIDRAIMTITRVTNDALIRTETKTMTDLLKFKTQGKSNKGVSVAKSVDNNARIVMDGVRATYADLLASEVDEDIRRTTKKRTEERKALETMTESDARDEAQKRLDELDVIIAKYRDSKEALLKEKADVTVSEIDKELEKMDEEMARKVNEGEEVTNAELLNYSALQIKKQVAEGREVVAELNEIDREILSLRRTNTELRKTPIESNRSRIVINKKNIERLKRERLATQTAVIDKLREANKALGEVIEEGKASLKTQKMNEAQRKLEISRIGVAAVKHKKIKAANTYDDQWTRLGETAHKLGEIPLSPFKAPLYSFEFMLKYIDYNHSMGEGELYNRFMKSDNGVGTANAKYNEGLRLFNDEVGRKVAEIFGGEGVSTKKVLSQVMKDAAEKIEHPGIFIEVGKDETSALKEISMSKGQALYTYMVWQMADGRAKLEAQGYTESSINDIEQFLGADYIEFASWVQDEYLPQLRYEKYNPTHERLFGTSMAQREHYFPFKIDDKDIREKDGMGEYTVGQASIITGNLINRVRNKSKIKTEANAFEVLFEYGKNMEDWNAYAEVRRDLNGLLQNRYFRNLMEANEEGSFKIFKMTCEIATRSFRDEEKNKTLNSFFTKLNKSLAGGAISYRINTALKQTLSMPAFLDYSCNPQFLAIMLKNATPLTRKGTKARYYENYKWCYENIPAFKDRVEAGDVGNEKLSEKGFSKALDRYTEIGMAPNKLVDAVTISIGAKSIYQYAYKTAINGGMTEEAAHQKAVREAEICFNQSQQSSDPAYLSIVQSSGNIFWKSLTNFQNSNMGYYRKTCEGLIELQRNILQDGIYNTKLAEFKEKGMTEAEAKSAARMYFFHRNTKAAKRVALFGYAMNTLWAIGGIGLLGYTYSGDDEDYYTQDEASSIRIAARLAPIMGTVFLGNAVNAFLSRGEYSPMMLWQELNGIWKDAEKSYLDNGGVSFDTLFRTAAVVLKFFGVNLETFENYYIGVDNAVRNGDWDSVDTMFVINAPASQRKNVSERIYNREIQQEIAERSAEIENSDMSKRRKEDALMMLRNEGMDKFVDKVSRAYKYLPSGYKYFISSRKAPSESRIDKLYDRYDWLNMTPYERDCETVYNESDKLINRYSSNPDNTDEEIDVYEKKVIAEEEAKISRLKKKYNIPE